jgi:hypothetical protein
MGKSPQTWKSRKICKWMDSITKLHLVGISTESSTMHGSMNIKQISDFSISWLECITDSSRIQSEAPMLEINLSFMSSNHEDQIYGR